MTHINFNNAVYACAAHQHTQWPVDVGAEVAFAGRSNVGKSSALNAIAHHKKLAHTSKTPGRTRQIVFFNLDSARRLVDLPGYGYAKVPEKLRQHWQRLITDYLTQRTCLRGLVVPMDIRRPLTDLDQTMLQCCWDINLPTHILLTKSDKFTSGRATNTLYSVRDTLKSQHQSTVQLFSAVTRQGVGQLKGVISDWLVC